MPGRSARCRGAEPAERMREIASERLERGPPAAAQSDVVGRTHGLAGIRASGRASLPAGDGVGRHCVRPPPSP